jgi:GDP/UDP-N,N'-diacetylbacillosamine 2-epimerase (hydrolysing)
MTRRVCVVITARPSYARIKTALAAIRAHPELELQLVVGASALLERYGTTVEVIEQDGFDVAERVYMVLEGENLVTSAKSTGIGIVELATVFDNLRPEVVVTVADRYETLATAVAASYMNIPLAHTQGGEITKSIDDKVRHAVTKLADLHFVSNQAAGRRVIGMGEPPQRVFVTGCPSIDLAAETLEENGDPLDPFQTYGGVGSSFDFSDGYIVVVQHPVTTEYEQCRQHVTETLEAVHELDVPTFWFWPNVDAGSDGTSKGIRTYRELVNPPRIHFFRNMTPEDFLRLVYNSRCIVGNSSVGIRECSFLGIPAVNIGSRQEGRERGPNVIDVKYDQTEIAEAITKQMEQGRFRSDPTYGDGRAGRRIADLLATRPLEIET